MCLNFEPRNWELGRHKFYYYFTAIYGAGFKFDSGWKLKLHQNVWILQPRMTVWCGLIWVLPGPVHTYLDYQATATHIHEWGKFTSSFTVQMHGSPIRWAARTIYASALSPSLCSQLHTVCSSSTTMQMQWCNSLCWPSSASSTALLICFAASCCCWWCVQCTHIPSRFGPGAMPWIGAPAIMVKGDLKVPTRVQDYWYFWRWF